MWLHKDTFADEDEEPAEDMSQIERDQQKEFDAAAEAMAGQRTQLPFRQPLRHPGSAGYNAELIARQRQRAVPLPNLNIPEGTTRRQAASNQQQPRQERITRRVVPTMVDRDSRLSKQASDEMW